MWLALGYVATGILTIAGLSFQRGHKDARYATSGYNPEDLFIPLITGLVWPLTIPTYVMYKIGFGVFKRQEAKQDKQTQIANEKRKQELALAEEMKEVEKILQSHNKE